MGPMLTSAPGPAEEASGEAAVQEDEVCPAAAASVDPDPCGSSQETDEDYFETWSHQSESTSEIRAEAFESASDAESITSEEICLKRVSEEDSTCFEVQTPTAPETLHCTRTTGQHQQAPTAPEALYCTRSTDPEQQQQAPTAPEALYCTRSTDPEQQQQAPTAPEALYCTRSTDPEKQQQAPTAPKALYCTRSTDPEQQQQAPTAPEALYCTRSTDPEHQQLSPTVLDRPGFVGDADSIQTRQVKTPAALEAGSNIVSERTEPPTACPGRWEDEDDAEEPTLTTDVSITDSEEDVDETGLNTDQNLIGNTTQLHLHEPNIEACRPSLGSCETWPSERTTRSDEVNSSPPLQSKSEDCLVCSRADDLPSVSRSESHHSLPDLPFEGQIRNKQGPDWNSDVQSVLRRSKNYSRNNSMRSEEIAFGRPWKTTELDSQSSQPCVKTLLPSISTDLTRVKPWHSVPENICLHGERETEAAINYFLQKSKLRESGSIGHLQKRHPELPLHHKPHCKTKYRNGKEFHGGGLQVETLLTSQTTHCTGEPPLQGGANILSEDIIRTQVPTGLTSSRTSVNNPSNQQDRQSQSASITSTEKWGGILPNNGGTSLPRQETGMRDSGSYSELNSCSDELVTPLVEIENGNHNHSTNSNPSGEPWHLADSEGLGLSLQNASSSYRGTTEGSSDLGSKEVFQSPVLQIDAIDERPRKPEFLDQPTLNCKGTALNRTQGQCSQQVCNGPLESKTESNSLESLGTGKTAHSTSHPTQKNPVIIISIERTGAQATRQTEIGTITVERLEANGQGDIEEWPTDCAETKVQAKQTSASDSDACETPLDAADTTASSEGACSFNKGSQHGLPQIAPTSVKATGASFQNSTDTERHSQPEAIYQAPPVILLNPQHHHTWLGSSQEYVQHIHEKGKEDKSTNSSLETKEKVVGRGELSESEYLAQDCQGTSLTTSEESVITNLEVPQRGKHFNDSSQVDHSDDTFASEEFDSFCTLQPGLALCEDIADSIPELAQCLFADNERLLNMTRVSESPLCIEITSTPTMVQDNISTDSANSEDVEDNGANLLGSNSSLYKAVQKPLHNDTPGKSSKFLAFPKITSFKKNKSLPPENQDPHSQGIKTEELENNRDENETESLRSFGKNSHNTLSPASNPVNRKFRTKAQYHVSENSDDDDFFEKSTFFNRSMRKASGPGRIDLDEFSNAKSLENVASCSNDLEEGEGTEDQINKPTCETIDRRRSKTPDGRKFKVRLALAHRSFSSLFDSKSMEKENMCQEVSKGTLKAEKDRAKPRQPSWKTFRKSKENEASKKSIPASLSTPQEDLLSPNSQQQNSCDPPRRLSKEKLDIENAQSLIRYDESPCASSESVYSPQKVGSHFDVILAEERAKETPLDEQSVQCTLSSESQSPAMPQNSLQVPQDESDPATPISPSDYHLVNSPLTPYSPQMYSPSEEIDGPAKPLSPKPQSPRPSANRKRFRYARATTATSMLSLGSSLNMDSFSEAPERPKTLKPRSNLMLSVNSLDIDSQKEDSGISSQSQTSLVTDSSISDLPRDEDFRPPNKSPLETRMREKLILRPKKLAYDTVPSQRPASDAEVNTCRRPLLSTDSSPRGPMKHDRRRQRFSLDDLWLIEERRQRRKLEDIQSSRHVQAARLPEDLLEVRIRLSMDSPVFDTLPLKLHPFSQSTPSGLDSIGWIRHISAPGTPVAGRPGGAAPSAVAPF